MKFINSSKDKTQCTFDDIQVGDLFLWDGTVFLKIKEINTPLHVHNAVNIDNGTTFGFLSSVWVKRYKGEVIIDLEEFTMYKEN